METINISKKNALQAYNLGDKKQKEFLETLIGKEIFSQKVTDRIKTFEDAVNEVGVTENQKILLDYNGIDSDLLAAQAFLKLTIIAKSLNEGWLPDWENSSESKWYTWFNNYKSGFGFSNTDYVGWNAYSYCSSRLCFKTSDLAKYAGTQFLELYNQFLTIK